MRKRGQGGIVTIVLIVVFVLIAVSLVFFYIRRTAENQTEKLDADKFDIDIKIDKAWTKNAGADLYVTLSRKGEGTLTSFKFLLKDNSNAIFTYTFNDTRLILKNMETKTYAMDCGQISGLSDCSNSFANIKSVAVAYGRKTTKGKEVFSEIVDIWAYAFDAPPNKNSPMHIPVNCPTGTSQPCIPATGNPCKIYTAICTNGEFGECAPTGNEDDATPCTGGNCLGGVCIPTGQLYTATLRQVCSDTSFYRICGDFTGTSTQCDNLDADGDYLVILKDGCDGGTGVWANKDFCLPILDSSFVPSNPPSHSDPWCNFAISNNPASQTVPSGHCHYKIFNNLANCQAAGYSAP